MTNGEIARDVAQKAHPIFVKNNWTYALVGVPDVAELITTVGELLNDADKYIRRHDDIVEVSTGRFSVKIERDDYVTTPRRVVSLILYDDDPYE